MMRAVLVYVVAVKSYHVDSHWKASREALNAKLYGCLFVKNYLSIYNYFGRK